MSISKPPLVAAEFEREARQVLPFLETMHEQAIEMALAVRPEPGSWLDTGCGPGFLVERARRLAPGTRFTLADPDEEMLALARSRLPDLAPERFVLAPSEKLPEGRFEVVTAILCHHYGDAEARHRSVRRCQELLSPGGVFITFEIVRADSDAGQELQRRRWGAWQRREGRSEEKVAAHLAREGKVYHPIPIGEHLRLLQAEGFSVAELFWRSYAQAGFFAIR